MRVRNKTTSQETEVVKKMPKGWSEIKNAATAPLGAVWVKSGSLFIKTKDGERIKNPNYEQKLLIKDENVFRERIKNSHRLELVENSNKTKKITRKELAEQIYAEKKRIGATITPIGRKTPLSKQEFVHRYLNGVGGTKGFKKAELESLLETMKKKPTARSK